MLIDKQTHCEKHQHQKIFYHDNNLNQTLQDSQYYVALLLFLLLLLMLQDLRLSKKYL